MRGSGFGVQGLGGHGATLARPQHFAEHLQLAVPQKRDDGCDEPELSWGIYGGFRRLGSALWPA